MAFKTFAPGVLTSSDVNTFLMRQSVITCTAATRPASPNEGMLIYETDTDLVLVYSGTAWEVNSKVGAHKTYTPTLAGGGGWVFGAATAVGRYVELGGRMVHLSVQITWAGGTTAGTGFFVVTLPSDALANETTLRVGTGRFTDVSAGTVFDSAIAIGESPSGYFTVYGKTPATANNIGWTAVTSTGISGGLNVPRDTGDISSFNIVYEAAA
jgi:hypothetical protein